VGISRIFFEFFEYERIYVGDLNEAHIQSRCHIICYESGYFLLVSVRLVRLARQFIDTRSNLQ
jgi:hypothetical protein